MPSTTVQTKVRDLFTLLLKVGWADMFRVHFTWSESSTANTYLIDWLIRGEVDDFWIESDGGYHAWSAVHRKPGLLCLLHFLRKSDGDINFADEKGQTLLHVFLRNSLADLPRKTSTKVVRSLLRLGASVNAVDADDCTPMHLAATKVRKSLIHMMLPSFTNVRAASGFSADTVLHSVILACYKDAPMCEDEYTDIVRALVAKGANPNFISASGMSAVQRVVGHSYYEMLRIFRDNGADLRDESLLHLACAEDKNATSQLKIIELLASEGCNVNAKDGYGESPIHRAVKHWLCDEIVERLIQLGADVNSRTNLGITPLHLGAAFSLPSGIDILLGAGAEVDAANMYGLTPLHVAASRACVGVVERLINGGADVNRRETTFGFTALHVAAAGCHESVELLLSKGVNVNAKARDDVTPLHLAALAGNDKAARVLVERGADVNCRVGGSRIAPIHMTAMCDKVGEVRNPIFERDDLRKFPGMHSRLYSWTKDRDNVAVAKILAGSGADVNAKDAIGRTPLQLATLNVASNMVEMILRLGAHVDEVDDEGRSAARNVLMSADTRGLMWLLKFGLNVDDEDVRIDVGATTNNRAVEHLMDHVTKMKMLGLTVRDDYVRADNCLEQPLVELQKIKSRVIDGSEVITVYDFLHMKTRNRANFAEGVMSMDLKNEFPKFFEVIEGSCKRAVNRAKLLEPAVEALREVTGMWWPDICAENIVSCLSDRYLRKLIASAKVNV